MKKNSSQLPCLLMQACNILILLQCLSSFPIRLTMSQACRKAADTTTKSRARRTSKPAFMMSGFIARFFPFTFRDYRPVPLRVFKTKVQSDCFEAILKPKLLEIVIKIIIDLPTKIGGRQKVFLQGQSHYMNSVAFRFYIQCDCS